MGDAPAPVRRCSADDLSDSGDDDVAVVKKPAGATIKKRPAAVTDDAPDTSPLKKKTSGASPEMDEMSDEDDDDDDENVESEDQESADISEESVQVSKTPAGAISKKAAINATADKYFLMPYHSKAFVGVMVKNKEAISGRTQITSVRNA